MKPTGQVGIRYWKGIKYETLEICKSCLESELVNSERYCRSCYDDLKK